MAEKKKATAKKGETKVGGDTIVGTMTIGNTIEKHPELLPVMFDFGLHCIGCHIAVTETLEQAAQAHGIDAKKFLEALNKAAKKK